MISRSLLSSLLSSLQDGDAGTVQGGGTNLRRRPADDATVTREPRPHRPVHAEPGEAVQEHAPRGRGRAAVSRGHRHTAAGAASWARGHRMQVRLHE